MTHAQRHSLRHYMLSMAVGVVASQAFVALQAGRDVWDHVAGVFVAGIVTLAMYVFDKRLKKRLAKLPFLPSLLGHLGAWCVVMVCGFYGGILLARVLERGTGPFDANLQADMRQTLLEDPVFRQAYAWGLAIFVLVAFVGELSKKLGPGVLFNWMRGYYRTPRQEERIFMFLDIKGSTGHAERLGDLKFSQLVREFFVDITPAIVESRGEISHFIGDEVVVTWRTRAGIEDCNCLRCFFRARAEIEERAGRYEEAYGLVPEFKAGLHVGPVIATEMGTVKSEIVYHGDAVNTAARIQGECGAAGADLLVSEPLMALLEVPGEMRGEAIGSFTLKGKAQPIGLFRVEQRSERAKE